MTEVEAAATGQHRMQRISSDHPTLVAVGQILCVIVPLAVWFAPLGIAPQTQHAFAIVGFMVVAWITQAMEFALAELIGCFLFWALRIVKFDEAFSGFADSTARGAPSIRGRRVALWRLRAGLDKLLRALTEPFAIWPSRADSSQRAKTKRETMRRHSRRHFISRHDSGIGFGERGRAGVVRARRRFSGARGEDHRAVSGRRDGGCDAAHHRRLAFDANGANRSSSRTARAPAAISAPSGRQIRPRRLHAAVVAARTAGHQSEPLPASRFRSAAIRAHRGHGPRAQCARRQPGQNQSRDDEGFHRLRGRQIPARSPMPRKATARRHI